MSALSVIVAITTTFSWPQVVYEQDAGYAYAATIPGLIDGNLFDPILSFVLGPDGEVRTVSAPAMSLKQIAARDRIPPMYVRESAA